MNYQELTDEIFRAKRAILQTANRCFRAFVAASKNDNAETWGAYFSARSEFDEARRYHMKLRRQFERKFGRPLNRRHW